jgi:hypothetical protein
MLGSNPCCTGAAAAIDPAELLDLDWIISPVDV